MGLTFISVNECTCRFMCVNGVFVIQIFEKLMWLLILFYCITASLWRTPVNHIHVMKGFSLNIPC